MDEQRTHDDDDTTSRRVRGILLGAAAEVYGFPPRYHDLPALPCTCGHRFDGHEGEEWEGRCTADGCPCETFVEAED